MKPCPAVVHLVLLALLSCLAGRADAQQSMAYLTRGIGSYRALEFDSAAGWLRRALTPPLVEALPVTEQVRGLAYLGATERFRGRSDSAAAAFRRMLRLDPASRPDPLVFPPEVTRMFDEIRVSYPILAMTSAPEATIDQAHPRYQIHLRPSAPHEVVVLLERTDRAMADTIYTGAVADTLVLEWNGRDRGGAPVASGRYLITAGRAGGEARGCQARIPLQVEATLPDTLVPPAPLGADQLLPEQARKRDGPAAFAGAAFLGAMALALPTLSEDADPGASYLVGGVLGVTGAIGLIRYRPGNAIPENVAANAIVRARREREVERVAAVNAERRRTAKLVLRASPAVLQGCEVP